MGWRSAVGTSVGGGLGMAALGTILGGLAVVHLTQKVTGRSLWLCYAVASAAACTAGAGLFAEGGREVGDMDLIPAGTGRVAREVAANAAQQVGH